MTTRYGLARLAIATIMFASLMLWLTNIPWGEPIQEGTQDDIAVGFMPDPTTSTLVPITPAPRTTTTTVAPTTTSTTIDEGWLCPDGIHIARMVGWPEVELRRLDEVMFRESRCDGRQHNTADPATGSRGLLQINGYWCQTTDFLQQAGVLWDCDDLFDDVTSLKAGLVIFNRSGWSPWGF